MIWLAGRQIHTQFLTVCALLAAAVVALAITGTQHGPGCESYGPHLRQDAEFPDVQGAWRSGSESVFRLADRFQ